MDDNSENFAAERLVPKHSRNAKSAVNPLTKNKKLAIALLFSVAVIIAIALIWSPTKRAESVAPVTKSAPDITPSQGPKVSSVPVEKVDANVEIKTPTEIITTVLKPKRQLVAAPSTLDDSDSQFLLAISDVAPTLAQWLIPKEQLRKWVMTVDLLAQGKLPKRYRPVDFPIDKFITEKNGSKQQLSDANFQRMQPIIQTVISIDPSLLAGYYQLWLPILEKAYSELGEKGTFDQRLQTAIALILDADQLDSSPTLSRPSVLFQYSDAALERASDVEKILWRMGPENSGKIQFFLRELRSQLSESSP